MKTIKLCQKCGTEIHYTEEDIELVDDDILKVSYIYCPHCGQKTTAYKTVLKIDLEEKYGVQLTQEQKYKICRYLVNKYAPIREDGLVHQVWVACEHCPFGPTGCKTDLYCINIPDELKYLLTEE